MQYCDAHHICPGASMDTVFRFLDWIEWSWASMPVWGRVTLIWLVIVAFGVLWLSWEVKHAPEMDDTGRVLRRGPIPNATRGERRRSGATMTRREASTIATNRTPDDAA